MPDTAWLKYDEGQHCDRGKIIIIISLMVDSTFRNSTVERPFVITLHNTPTTDRRQIVGSLFAKKRAN